ncbi:class I SAM-dependent DNA methyltransferase [Pacificoceanicola onchidii]|uniref:class I SAM-dependent DNA methyltransferase n=1 Tax=Pacificoceanicola onchidii TaxID=2562685 RepID=UPI0010A5CC46|nr:methyltransferase domain-containing protein [Pacificoceanicola onchidii]
MAESYFDKVYAARNADETRDLYNAWSKSYEAEVAENGYVTPGRCAEALVRFLPSLDAPVLDFGCGTGLSGLALRAAGVTVVDGVDLAEGMLAQAREKGAYRNLTLIGPEDALPQGYRAISAMGVIGAGAAPLGVLERIVDTLPEAGLTVFSFNDHTLEDPAYQSCVDRMKADGTVRELFNEYGEHLPGLNMNSRVYVLEKK